MKLTCRACSLLLILLLGMVVDSIPKATAHELRLGATNTVSVPQTSVQKNAGSNPDALACGGGTVAGYNDVSLDDYFCGGLSYLSRRGAVDGYSDGTFRPYSNVSRGQFSKMIAKGALWPIDTAGGPHFVDVPTSNVFYPFIETAYKRGIIGGYTGDGYYINPCTGLTETLNQLYFRWCSNITRQQMLKFTTLAVGFNDNTSAMASPYSDIATTDSLFHYVEVGVMRDVVAQYPPDAPSHPVCGSNSQPCFFPTNAVLRADAVAHIYLVLAINNYGQAFAQRRGQWVTAQANLTTPQRVSVEQSGDFIVALVAMTDIYNCCFAEAGAQETTDGRGNFFYYPYYSWGNSQTNLSGSQQATGYPLSPTVSYGYQVTSIGGDQW
ncbi:MAG: S-layer homology domain-containing protein [Chloroflexota bacterium]|nr:S-layer homology domain-containing protein [Chloroflexota bacterium]